MAGWASRVMRACFKKARPQIGLRSVSMQLGDHVRFWFDVMQPREARPGPGWERNFDDT